MTLKAGQIVIIGPKISRDEILQYVLLMQESKDDTDIAGPKTAAEPQTDANKPQTADEAQLVGLINQTRAEKGLPPLTTDPRLTAAARKHTELMMENGALSHQFPGEPDLQQRIDAENIPTDLEEENVGWDVNVAAAHQSLVEDPPHLRNILDPEVNVIGVAVVPSGDHVYVTEDFAHLTTDK